MQARPKALVSWSSGKDSAWALHRVRQEGELEVVGLLTTLNEEFERVAMHGVRRELLQAQARALDLPLWPVPLPWPCSNQEYEQRMARVVEQARRAGVQSLVFGDLFLEEVRQYRIRQLEGTGLEPRFPLWGLRTDLLAREMVEAGLRAVLTCVDPSRMDAAWAGRPFDGRLLEDLPPHVDPCGENGEFHTFCFAGPIYRSPIPVQVTRVVERDGFWFADLEFEAAGGSGNHGRQPSPPGHSL